MKQSNLSCCCSFCSPGIDILQLPHLQLIRQLQLCSLPLIYRHYFRDLQNES